MADPVPLRPTVADAWNRIDTHEQVCAERYKRLDEGQSDLKTIMADHKADTGRRLDSIDKALTRAMWALLGTAAALIGYLLTHIIPGLHP